MSEMNRSEMVYDLVDKDDRFICIGSKQDVVNRKLYTRGVHIFVFNNEEKLLICKRSPFKKRYANQYTSSAGGHVEQGEDYIEAAYRELQEELGITVKLYEVGRFDVITKIEKTIHRLFIGKTDKIFPDKNEIASWQFREPELILNDLFLHPRRYAKPFQEALRCYTWFTRQFYG